MSESFSLLLLKINQKVWRLTQNNINDLVRLLTLKLYSVLVRQDKGNGAWGFVGKRNRVRESNKNRPPLKSTFYYIESLLKFLTYLLNSNKESLVKYNGRKLGTGLTFLWHVIHTTSSQKQTLERRNCKMKIFTMTRGRQVYWWLNYSPTTTVQDLDWTYNLQSTPRSHQPLSGKPSNWKGFTYTIRIVTRWRVSGASFCLWSRYIISLNQSVHNLLTFTVLLPLSLTSFVGVGTLDPVSLLQSQRS